MSTLTIEGWCKSDGDRRSSPVGDIHFDIQGPTHTALEQAEERLQQSHEPEAMVDVDMETLNLVLPEGYGPLADCRLRGCRRPCNRPRCCRSMPPPWAPGCSLPPGMRCRNTCM